MYQLCLFLTTDSLYCVLDLFFFLKMTKIKAIKEEIQNDAKVQTNPL